MAHYRNIEVDGQRYRWVTWSTATKVINETTNETKTYPNAEWGTPLIDATYHDCKWKEDGRADYYPHGFVVSSGDVRGMILGERRWKDHPCRYHPKRIVTGLTSDPFDAEIRDKTTLVNNCPDCLAASWMNT